jgi:tetratricopeptide (TPR) repeat protein
MAPFTLQKYTDALQQSLEYESHSRYDASIQVLENALPKTADAGRQDWEASILGILGTLYLRTGRYPEAEVSLNKSVAMWTRLNGPNSKDLVGPLAGLGGLYYEAGQFSRAEKLIGRALEVQFRAETDSVTDSQITAMLHTNLAGVYFRQHKDDLATQEAETALQKFALINNAREDTARNYSSLGAIDLRSGSMPEALSYFEKALTLWQAVYGENNSHTAEGWGDLAFFYLTDGQPQKAEPSVPESGGNV